MKDICPICSSILSRHLHQPEIDWFCPQCRQEIPNLDVGRVNRRRRRFLQQRSSQPQPELTNIPSQPNRESQLVDPAPIEQRGEAHSRS